MPSVHYQVVDAKFGINLTFSDVKLMFSARPGSRHAKLMPSKTSTWHQRMFMGCKSRAPTRLKAGTSEALSRGYAYLRRRKVSCVTPPELAGKCPCNVETAQKINQELKWANLVLGPWVRNRRRTKDTRHPSTQGDKRLGMATEGCPDAWTLRWRCH